MAKKYAPRKVFVLENGEYIEISYEELCRREEIDSSYRDKLFVPMHGMIMEVTSEQYDDFYRDYERQRYLRRKDIRYGLLSIDSFDTETDHGTDYLCICTDDVAEVVAHTMLLDKLRMVIHTLSDEEQELIDKHFYQEIPQTALAEELGISQQAVSKRIAKICAKIKNLIEF